MKTRLPCRWLIAAVILLASAAVSFGAEEATRPASRPADVLGQSFDSPTAGIAFRAPADCREITKGPGDADIVEFVNDEKHWTLKVAMWTTDHPLPLRADPSSQTPGLMESTIQQTRLSDPGVAVIRNDIIRVNDAPTGLLIFRYSIGTQRHLTQIALIQKSLSLYYILNLTTPATKGPIQDDPDETSAMETFSQVLGTVKLLDRSKIREDQVQRLFRTRALFTRWTAKFIHSRLIPQQWLRIIRDGRDVGYSYIVERPDRRGDSDGILIGVRSRMVNDDSKRVDSESWFYSNIDRAHASWTTGVRISDDKGKLLTYGTEIGADDVTPDAHRLTVKTVRKSSDSEPVVRDLPPWYLPQAFSQLLPRLLPPDEPKTYMFATYVTARREVMSRYVEVLPQATVNFNGREIQAVRIHDRYGLAGTDTTDYLSPAGKFLGSLTTTEITISPGITRPSNLMILPSTREELLRIWQHADLSEPALPDQDKIGR